MGLIDELTRKTNHFIGWSKTGFLFFGNHKYSNQECAELLFILISTATCGFLNWMQSEEGEAISFACGASLGFLLSYTMIMSPSLHKRLVTMWSCANIAKEIQSNIVNDNPSFIDLVNSVIKQIEKHEEKRRALTTWEVKERLLTNLLHWLQENTHNSQMLNETLRSNEIISSLDHCPAGPPTQLRFKQE